MFTIGRRSREGDGQPAVAATKLENPVGCGGHLESSVVRADALSPEPLDIWRREIQELRARTELWDTIAGGNRQAS